MNGGARRTRAVAGAAGLLAVSLAAALAACGGSAGSGATAAGSRPNVVIIQADDQVAGTVTKRLMPNTVRLLVRHGTTFTDYITPTPQCCPSRSSLVTGQYAHNHGVLSNGPGYPDLRDKASTLPVWLEEAGYQTAQVGKYINGYDKVQPATKPAPGFGDQWALLAEDNRYYGWHLAINGKLVRFGNRPRDYVTTVLTRKAVKWIRADAAGPKPFFLMLDQHAPHADPGVPPCTHSAVPAPGDVGLRRSIHLPDIPSIDERNVSDKPSFIRHLQRLGHTLRRQQKHYGCALATLRGIDRGVRAVYEAVKRSGQLDNTVFIYISDNGYLYGQHRVAGGKVLPYQEALLQPLVIRIPAAYRDGAPRIPRVSDPVANIDLAPTIVQLAGACTSPSDGCRVMDGRSLLPLLEGDRSGFRHRALAVEFGDSKAGNNGVCAYQGVETASQVFVEYRSEVDPKTHACVPSHEAEHYYLRRDPYELHNRWPAPKGSPAAADERRLRHLTAVLQDCAGIRGRDPKPPSGHYCR